MRKNTPGDATARTARRSIDGFDCELPDDVLNELVASRRPLLQKDRSKSSTTGGVWP